MSNFDQDKSKYAFIKIHGNYGYGHMEAVIYNITDILWRGPKIFVTSQIGTSGNLPRKNEEIYAWRLGAAADTYDTLRLNELEAVIKPLRRIDKKLDKMTDDFGSPVNFQEFLFRVLIASGVEHVIVNPNYGGGYSCELKDLPRIDMSASWAKSDLRREIDKLAEALIEKFYPDRTVKEEAA